MKRRKMTLEEHQNNIGKKFGKLTVLGLTTHLTKRGNNYIYYKCKCDCGNLKEVYSNNIIDGKTTSCGCYRNEQIHKANYIGNKYEIKDDHVIGYTTKGEKFYIDKEDLNKIKPYTWSINDNGYLRANIKGKNIRMHRFILDLVDYDKNLIIDHINHNTYDNRKINLRIATSTQNTCNTSLRRNNKSGVTGVSWDNRCKKWEAKISIKKKYTHIGYFENFDDAVKARKEAEEKYYKEYSYDNSMKLSSIIEE